ncbi:MAG: hypothetical protein R2941_04895 [Desulfobacterales bacterium]
MIGQIIEAIDDRLNPVAVRELRQAVQSRVLVGMFMLFLIIMLLVMAGFVSTGSPETGASLERTANLGREAFEVLFGVLVFSVILFVPVYTGARMSLERSAENMDLLFATAIGPGTVIRGKLCAGMVITLLFFSACLPFMTLTWFLRGVDLPSVFVILCMAFVGIAAAIQFALCMGCSSHNRFFRMLLGILTLGLLMGEGSAIVALARDMLRSGVGSRLADPDFWHTALLVLVLILLGAGLFHTIAIAEISPPSSNRALGIRSYIFCAWLLTGGTAFFYARFFHKNDGLQVWFYISILLFSFGFLHAVSEKDGYSPRVAARIPRYRMMRIPAFFFYSGAANGIAWILLMSGLTFLTVLPMGKRFSGLSAKDTEIFAGIFLYACCYALTGLLIRRTLLAKWVLPKYTWVAVLSVMAAACILPMFFSIMGGNSSFDFSGNIFALIARGKRDRHLAFAVRWLLPAVICNIPWFLKQVSRFAPPHSPDK